MRWHTLTEPLIARRFRRPIVPPKPRGDRCRFGLMGTLRWSK